MIDGEIPYFIKQRGCINCESSKQHKKKHGTDYGFDHELMAGCLVIGCFDYGHSLSNPFLDPKELVKFRGKLNDEQIQNAKNYVLKVKKRLGHFYKEIGINLDDLMISLTNDK